MNDMSLIHMCVTHTHMNDMCDTCINHIAFMVHTCVTHVVLCVCDTHVNEFIVHTCVTHVVHMCVYV